ncbi:MAG: hypothetical protein QF475_02495, partial [Candidatus Undinarchaeales archaeon]|nr:hypothetical protein [Candidatus Undinarchaeales archaeon]
EEGIEMVRKYDALRPDDLDMFLKFVDMTEEEFVACVDTMRSPIAWKKNEQGAWEMPDNVWDHANDPGVEEARLPIVGDHNYSLTDSPREKDEKRYYF